MHVFSWLWLAVMILMAVAEASTVALVSIWFLGGAAAAFIASLLGAQLWLQIALFIAVSVGLLLLLRPFAKKFLQPKITRTNFDRIIDTQVPVTEKIDNLSGSGAIKAEGAVWTARSEDGQPIEEGSIVTIVRIEGVKAIVRR